MVQVGRPKKGQYKRSTPVIRLQRNVAKLERNAELVLNRLSTWLSDGDTALVKAVEHTAEITQAIADLKADVVVLEETGFVPPKRSAAVVFYEGQSVAIAVKHRQKYVQAFERELKTDPDYLDGLVIVKIIESGEITVRRGQKTPFIVRKSHIVEI
jgi:hypothetical protein